MAPHPTYVVLRGESGKGISETLYVGPSQKEAHEIAQRECGYGEVKPGKDFIQYRYFTKIEVWSDGEKVTESGYTRNGHRTKNNQIMRDKATDVSSQVGEIE